MLLIKFWSVRTKLLSVSEARGLLEEKVVCRHDRTILLEID